MQYILTEGEYLELREAGSLIEQQNKVDMQRLCTLVADHMPITWEGWGKKPYPFKPWGCMLSAAACDEEWYCDSCPVIDLCPYKKKEFSK